MIKQQESLCKKTTEIICIFTEKKNWNLDIKKWGMGINPYAKIILPQNVLNFMIEIYKKVVVVVNLSRVLHKIASYRVNL